MRKARLHFMLITILIIILTANSTVALTAKSISQKYVVGYEITIVNEGNKTYPLEDMEKLTLIPEDNHQKLISVTLKINGTEVDWKFAGINDEGNWEIEILNPPENLPPNSRISLETQFEVEISQLSPPTISVEESGDISDIPQNLVRQYCKMEGIWAKSANASLLANRLKGNETNILKIVFKFIKWIENNIKYPMGLTPKLPTYPDETIALGEGDCDDQANLLVAMCRSIGIPAYTQLSFLYMKGEKPVRRTLLEGRLTIEAVNVAGHGWAVIYVPPWGWIPVDMTYFEGEKLVSGRIISINIEDHIRGAALFHVAALVTENIVKSDYIKELKEWMSELKEYNLKWSEKYYMLIKEPKKPRDGMIIASAIGLIALTSATFAVYFYVKKRRTTSLAPTTINKVN